MVTGWRGTAAEGLPPTSIPQNAYAPFQLATHLATDAGSGAVVLAGVYGGGKGGVYVQQVLPGAGKAVVLSDGGNNNDYVEGLSGRIGAPGVYVAYADTKAVHLYRYGGGSKTLARGPFTSATVCAGPDGRLWVAWGDTHDGLFVTRSNRAAGGFEPVQKLTLPQQTTNGLSVPPVRGLRAARVDLFAEVADKANGLGFWHTHVLAQAHRCRPGPGQGPSATSASSRDAGDPVGGATISVGGRHVKTACERPGDAEPQARLVHRGRERARVRRPRRSGSRSDETGSSRLARHERATPTRSKGSIAMHRTSPLTRSVAGALLAVAALAAGLAVPAAGAPPKTASAEDQARRAVRRQLPAACSAASSSRQSTSPPPASDSRRSSVHGPLGTFTEYPARYGGTLVALAAGSPWSKASNASLALSALKAAPNETLHELGATGQSTSTPATSAVRHTTRLGHGKPDHRWAMVAFLAGGCLTPAASVVEDDNGEPTEASLAESCLADGDSLSGSKLK